MNWRAKFEAKLLELNINIEKLKEININDSNITNRIGTLKSETDEKVKKCYQDFENGCFLEESLIGIYSTAIKKLEDINEIFIKPYEELYIICQTLKEVEIMENSNPKMISEKLIIILKKILLANNIIIDNNIIERVYQLTYQTIKYELIFEDSSILLDYILQEEVHFTHILNYIREDLKNISGNNLPLKQKLYEISQNGFDNKYFFDKDLILEIIKTDNNMAIMLEENNRKRKENRLLNELANFKEKLDYINNKYNQLKSLIYNPNGNQLSITTEDGQLYYLTDNLMQYKISLIERIKLLIKMKKCINGLNIKVEMLEAQINLQERNYDFSDKEVEAAIIKQRKLGYRHKDILEIIHPELYWAIEDYYS